MWVKWVKRLPKKKKTEIRLNRENSGLFFGYNFFFFGRKITVSSAQSSFLLVSALLR